jgi:hypothetical protein
MIGGLPPVDGGDTLVAARLLQPDPGRSQGLIRFPTFKVDAT